MKNTIFQNILFYVPQKKINDIGLEQRKHEQMMTEFLVLDELSKDVTNVV